MKTSTPLAILGIAIPSIILCYLLYLLFTFDSRSTDKFNKQEVSVEIYESIITLGKKSPIAKFIVINTMDADGKLTNGDAKEITRHTEVFLRNEMRKQLKESK